MDPRFSTFLYPRYDSAYQAKQSLNFDSIRSKIYEERQRSKKVEVYRWFAHLLLGVMVGTIAFLMAITEEIMQEAKADFTNTILQNGNTVWIAWVYYSSFCVFCAALASIFTVYVGPGANGSGVAEIMGLLNGVNYKGAIQFDTLFVKIVGVVLAVVGCLCVGKEGPLAHIGAIMGVVVIYAPLEGFKCFQNDSEKRTFIAAGASAGVSAAFGSPIGGSLFAYEVSKPTTFWTFSMLWRIFFCSGISTFTLSVFTSLMSGAPVTLSDSGILKFAKLTQTTSAVTDLPAAIVIGAISGFLGAFFIFVNTQLGLLRKKAITKKWMKILETCFFSLATASSFFFVTAAVNNCVEIPADISEEYINFTCTPQDYSPLGTLFFNTEGGTIKTLMAVELPLNFLEAGLFFLVWYVFTITTYGVHVPSGLFLPGIIVGCALGQLYGLFVQVMYPDTTVQQSYMIMGASAMLCGYTRLTYSLAVIMLETTQSINLFIPIIFTLIISFSVGQSFNRSLYERALRTKQIPLLRNHCPRETERIRAEQIMATPVLCTEGVPTVQSLIRMLQTTHSAFPVLNIQGNVVGIIPKNFIIILIERNMWYDSTDQVSGRSVSIHYRRSSLGAERKKLTMNQRSEENDHAEELFPHLNINQSEASESLRSNHHPLEDHDQEQSVFDLPTKSSNVDELDPNQIEEAQNKEKKLSQTHKKQPQLDQNASDTAILTRRSFTGIEIGYDKPVPMTPALRNEKVQRQAKIIKYFTSDFDYALVPQNQKVLDWTFFNTDFHSTDRTYEEIEDICEANRDKRIDLRPYMIETPFQAQTTDKMQKLLDIFRHMHLRHLIVMNPANGELEGIITRQDLFAYMSL